MPQIAEIKEIDGQLWVRVPLKGEQGAITLWTEDEIAQYRIRCRAVLIEEICEMATK